MNGELKDAEWLRNLADVRFERERNDIAGRLRQIADRLANTRTTDAAPTSRRFAQPCDTHEYIEPDCPDCGKLVAVDVPTSDDAVEAAAEACAEAVVQWRVARAICWAFAKATDDCSSKCFQAGRCMAAEVDDCFKRDATAALEASGLIAENERLREALRAARKHLHTMQHQARQYIEPSGYTAFDRKRIAFANDQEAKDSLFIGDVIYLLDGPEQRALEAKIDAALKAAQTSSEDHPNDL